MIESVQARQRGAFQFESHYDNLCAIQDSAPLPSVKAHLAQGVIDINGDRIRLNDWMPIIDTVKINKTLQFIATRSYYQIQHEEDEKKASIQRRKLPSIRSKEITHRLVKALKDCLFVSPALSCIELQGLALRERDLQLLVKGIMKSQTLRHLSLECCRIGDQGLEVLCKGLNNSQHINSVNLSGCSLSHRGAECLAAVIKNQGIQRHNVAWRDSLRYRRPDLDRMSGLRRITCNNNPLLGDEGSRSLAEALKDDLWLKAMDLQSCGISRLGAQYFLEVLKYNTTLVVLDLRRNPLIDRDVMHALMEELMLNTNGQDGEYKWIKAEEPADLVAKQTKTRSRRRATKVLNSSLAKKTTIKVTPTSSRRRLRRSEVLCSTVSRSPGLPWRTAERAHRYRGHPPDVSRFVAGDECTDEMTSQALANAKKQRRNDEEDEEEEEDRVLAARVVVDMAGAGGEVVAMGQRAAGGSRVKRIAREAEAMNMLEESHLSLELSDLKTVQIELEQMRRCLREERLSRAKADQRVVQLILENGRLAEEVSTLRRTAGWTGGKLADEGFLESVESSFRHFHSFIDMLREAGLGQLVTMAGLDQSQMPFGSAGKNNSHDRCHADGENVTPSSHDRCHADGENVMPSSHDRCHADGENVTPSSDFNGGEDTTYANIPLASSAFVSNLARRQRPVPAGQGVGVSMSQSYSEEEPVLIGKGTRGAAPFTQNETAKMEADELYTRLVKETKGALETRGTSVTKPSAVNVAAALEEEAVLKLSGWNEKLGSMEGVEKIGLGQDDTTAPEYANQLVTSSGARLGGGLMPAQLHESAEEPSSFFSENGSCEGHTPRSSRGAVDDSQEDDDDHF